MFEFIRIIRWQDVIDIIIVAFLFYQLITIIRGTRSVQMVIGLVVLVGLYFMARILDLVTMLWLLETFLGSLFIIIIIVFQDDIKKALTQVGRSPFQKSMDMVDKDMDEIVRTVFYLSKRRIGALIVIERDMGLREYVDSGFHVDALLSREMLISIFMPVSPLHDGGVVIRKGRIQTAGAILPLTQNPYIDKHYGTRHRAAIGLSEETDAVILVVSEETQGISIVQHGALTAVSDEVSLTNSLRAIFIGGRGKDALKYSWQNWFSKK